MQRGLVDRTVENTGILSTGLSTKASKTPLVCKVVLKTSDFLYRYSNQSLKTAFGLQSGIENQQILIPISKPEPLKHLWFAKRYRESAIIHTVIQTKNSSKWWLYSSLSHKKNRFIFACIYDFQSLSLSIRF